MIRVHTIISGGQTGADRGGLLAARDLGLKRGGMAPLGWRAEDGVIPQEFRVGMLQSLSAAYPVRTRSNVEASSGTLIFAFRSPLTGGSLSTQSMCFLASKPVIVFNPGWAWINSQQIDWARGWLDHFKISVLNVAGPRESKESGIQEATRAALAVLLRPEDEEFGG